MKHDIQNDYFKRIQMEMIYTDRQKKPTPSSDRCSHYIHHIQINHIWTYIIFTPYHRRTRRTGAGSCSPSGIFQIVIFGQNNIAIFGQNHLVFWQATEKTLGQLTSAPLNETDPVHLCSLLRTSEQNNC